MPLTPVSLAQIACNELRGSEPPHGVDARGISSREPLRHARHSILN
jgi:hypothetical protein